MPMSTGVSTRPKIAIKQPVPSDLASLPFLSGLPQLLHSSGGPLYRAAALSGCPHCGHELAWSATSLEHSGHSMRGKVNLQRWAVGETLLHIPKINLTAYLAREHGRARVVKNERVCPASRQVFMDIALSSAGAVVDKLIPEVQAKGYFSTEAPSGLYSAVQFGAAHRVWV